MSKDRKQPTMADVARLAGVSSMTVSRAFKAESYINPATRDAILKAAAELGYVLDNTAAGLSSRKTGFVAVTIPSINNANFADTIRGMTDGLRQTRLQVLLGYTNYSVDEEERLVAQLLTRRPEAIVVTGGRHTDACRRMLQNAAIPVIETWDMPSDPIDAVVGFSNAHASELLVDHLVSTGRSRIAFVGGDVSDDTRGADRRRGFVRRMQELGLDTSRLASVGSPPISMREGAQAFSDLIEKWPDTDAVACVSDPAAFGVLTECQRRGIAVPDQIALCGFGAYEISDVCVPAITTVDPQCYEIGKNTAGLILKAIDTNGKLSPLGTLELESILRIRSSSARS